MADLCPVAKVNPPREVEKDFRPISLTPVLAKVLESFIVKWTRSACPRVDPGQYGVIKNSSTTHALIEILHPIFEKLDKPGHYAHIFLIDFAKAFDHISHGKALNKMTGNGVPKLCVEWYRAFLTGCQQRVKIANVKSSWNKINGGVPQGTLNGPEIFMHMVSDLQTSFPTIKYVDDTTIVEILSIGEESQMQKTLDMINVWSQENEIFLNATKTKEVLVNFNKKEIPISQLNINGEPIQQVVDSKLLGITISRDLKWDKHVSNIHSKAAKRLHYLPLLKHSGVPSICKVYISLIRSVLEYACPVWSTSLSQGSKSLIESVQKRACRIIHPSLPYEQSREDLGLTSIENRHINICKSFYGAMQKPEHSLHHLLPQETDKPYNLRQVPKYHLPKCRTNRYKNSFIPWCLYRFSSNIK